MGIARILRTERGVLRARHPVGKPLQFELGSCGLKLWAVESPFFGAFMWFQLYI